MLRYVIGIAVAAVFIGSQGARIADMTTRSAGRAEPASAQARPQATSNATMTNGPHSLSVAGDGQGHFRLDVSVEGRPLGFIVDTGASVMVLRESDAALIGIRPTRNDYSATVTTANGKVQAAPVRLNRVEVGDIGLDDVRAMVLPDEMLGQNLLGVSFLSRLKRYEVAGGRLVLEQ